MRRWRRQGKTPAMQALEFSSSAVSASSTPGTFFRYLLWPHLFLYLLSIVYLKPHCFLSGMEANGCLPAQAEGGDLEIKDPGYGLGIRVLPPLPSCLVWAWAMGKVGGGFLSFFFLQLTFPMTLGHSWTPYGSWLFETWGQKTFLPAHIKETDGWCYVEYGLLAPCWLLLLFMLFLSLLP